MPWLPDYRLNESAECRAADCPPAHSPVGGNFLAVMLAFVASLAAWVPERVLADIPTEPHYAPAAVCANFSEQLEPGETPTFPGMWVNPARKGNLWHINYSDRPEQKIAFTWMHFDSTGAPVWVQSDLQDWDFSNGTGFFDLMRYRASDSDGEAGPEPFQPHVDAPVRAFALTIRIIPNDPSLLAISWAGPDGVWHDECIHDASRVGPFFVPGAAPTLAQPAPVINPNASFTGLYYEPEVSGYGVAWSILQLPQKTGPAKYLEALHLLTFDDNGYPVWLEAKQPEGIGTSLPPAERVTPGSALQLYRVTRRTDLSDPACLETQNCLRSTFAGETFRRTISPARVDMRLDLRGTSTTVLSRPSAEIPAHPVDGLAANFVRLDKITAINQISVDKAVCVAVAPATTCKVTLNWAAVARPSWNNFRIVSVPIGSSVESSISNSLVGTFEHTVIVGQRVQFKMLANNSNGFLIPIDGTSEIRAVSSTELPRVEFNAPAGCNVSTDCHVHAVGTQLIPTVAATSPLGISRVEIFEGPDANNLTPLCVDGCAGNGQGQYFGPTWTRSTSGVYRLWARAVSTNLSLASALVTHEVKFGVPPEAQLEIVRQNGQLNPATITTAEPVQLRATAPDAGGGVQIRTIEFLRIENGVEQRLALIDRIAGMQSPYVWQWTGPRVASGSGTSTKIQVRVTDNQGTSGVSSVSPARPLIIESLTSSLTVESYDSEGLESNQYPSAQAFDFEIGEPGVRLRAQLGNAHNFKRVEFRLQRGAETPIVLVACDSQSACNRSHHGSSWVASPGQEGSYSVSAIGKLLDDVQVNQSGNPLSLQIRTRSARTVQLTSPGSTQPLVVHADDPAESVNLSRTFLPTATSEQGRHWPRTQCAALVRSADLAAASASCNALIGDGTPSFTGGRCGIGFGSTSPCSASLGFQWRPNELCSNIATCTKEQTIVYTARTAYDGVKSSPPISILIPYAKFLSDSGVPTQLQPGRTASISLTFQNLGGTAWTPSDYRLEAIAASSGEAIQTWGLPAGVALAGNVAKNANVTFNLTITAPNTPGSYVLRWQLHRKRGAIWDSFGEASASKTIVVAGADPMSAVTNAAPATPVNPIASHDPTIGSVAAQAGVSGGAATYEIPFVVPPGRRAMQPSLALSYNSRNGNGTAGVGWSLSGLSSIHRCPRTIAQDGYVRPVRFDAEDALCLDGQRLVEVGAATEYGQDGAEYRTEIDSFQKITQHGGNLASGTTYFRVEAKSGEASVYGPGSRGSSGGLALDAQVKLQNPTTLAPSTQALSWLIAYRADRVGNSIDYLYSGFGTGQLPVFGAGEVLLKEVHYTGFNGARGNRSVKFSYGGGGSVAEGSTPSGTREDQSSSYLSGFVSRQTRLLQRVETVAQNLPVRRYWLSYSTTGSGRSALDKLQECAVDGAQVHCRPVTRFDWNRDPAPFTLKAAPPLNNSNDPLHEYGGGWSQSVRLEAAADFDGNGARDLLWIGRESEAQGASTVARLITLSPEQQRIGTVDITPFAPFLSHIVRAAGRADFDRDGRPELFSANINGRLVLNFWRAGSLDSSSVTPASQAYTYARPTSLLISALGEIHYVGDLTGDALPEIVSLVPGSCAGLQRIVVHRPLAPLDGTEATQVPYAFDSSVTLDLEGSCSAPVRGRRLTRVADFDGDGLADFWIRDERVDGTHGIHRGVRTAGGYSIGPFEPFTSLASDLDGQETRFDSLAYWVDVNGDGLDDWFYPRYSGGAGHWALRMNQGGRFGPRKVFDNAIGTIGIEFCGGQGGATSLCDERWLPWRSDRFRAMDYDSDGAVELLVPVSYAARVCTYRQESVTGSGECAPMDHPGPGGPSIGLPAPVPAGMGITPPKYPLAAVLTGQPTPSAATPECIHRYYCPEVLDDKVAAHPPGSSEFFGIATHAEIAPRDEYGVVSNTGPFLRAQDLKGLYASGAAVDDHSSYFMGALKVIEIDGEPVLVADESTGLVFNEASLDAGEDVYGDGQPDLLTKVSCYEVGRRPRAMNGCGVPVTYGNVQANGTYQSLGNFIETSYSLPGGLPLMTPAVLLNENRGASTTREFGLPATPDLMVRATDGLGNTTEWSYAPLGAKAGRTGANDVPLYARPFDKSGYVDSRHIYFTSSMPVVAEMRTSAVVGTRAYRYGYSEAMYNLEGRGFQGFRSITEEDVEAGTRSVTTFHQKYPLTGKIEQVQAFALHQGAPTIPLSEEIWTWRCNLGNVADTDACAHDLEAGDGRLPYLARKHASTYAGVVVPTGGTPTLVGERIESNANTNAAAHSAFCATGAVPGIGTLAGIDQYGNPTVQSSVVFDRGSDIAIASHCERVETSYKPHRPDLWWIDRVDQTRVQRTTNRHDASVAGIATIDAKETTTTFLWNDNTRTLWQQTVDTVPTDDGLASRVLFEYTGYGLPTLSTTRVRYLRPDGSLETAYRDETTHYETEGYFPNELRNALGHTSTLQIRARDGQPAWSVDPNRLKTTFGYDAFGFSTSTQFSSEVSSEVPARPREVRRAAAVVGTCRTNAKWRVTEVQGGAPTVETCFDSLGRQIMQSTHLFDIPNGLVSGQPDHAISKVKIDYTLRGLVARQSEPYLGASAVAWTTFGSYDFLGRPGSKTVQKGDATHGDLLTLYGYDGRTTTIDVCGTSGSTPVGTCLSMSRTQDSLGRFVRTVDANDGVTRFWHDALGNVAAIRDANGVVTKATYNALGQRIAVADPNQGAWSFAYNSAGELRRQTDARSITTDLTLDLLGRVTLREVSENDVGQPARMRTQDAFVWDTAASGDGGAVGALRSQRRDHLPISGSTPVPERSETYRYDALARRTSATVQQWQQSVPQTFDLAWRYDTSNGWLAGRAWNGEEGLYYQYDAFGHPQAITEGSNATVVYWRALQVDDRGSVSQFRVAGDTVTATRTVDPVTGQWTGIGYARGSTSLRTMSYGYDVFGNLRSQQIGGGVLETFAYDELHRLTRTARDATVVDYAYDDVGNLTAKSDYSQFTPASPQTPHYLYGNATKSLGGNAGPNAVREVTLKGGVGTQAMLYDANGNLIYDSHGFLAKFDATNLPVSTTRNGTTLTFGYGPDGQRGQQWGPQPEQQRIYVQGLERLANGKRKYALGDFGQVTYGSSGRKLEFFVTDRLGSIVAVLGQSGGNWNVVETRAFDAFGKPRDGAGADLPAGQEVLPAGTTTPKGFTAHEHLDAVRLIHMNGRAFDPHLGRFLSVDPIIQFPLNSQSLNPYSYILNNPLSGTDPTGYCEAKTGSHLKECVNVTAVTTEGERQDLGSVNLRNGADIDRLSGLTISINGADLGTTIVGAIESVKKGVAEIGKDIENVLPATGQAAQRAELGTMRSNLEGVGLALADPFVEDGAVGLGPLIKIGGLEGVYDVEYDDDQLIGPMLVELGLIAGTRGAGAEATALRRAGGLTEGVAGFVGRPRLLASVGVPEGLVPGTTLFGNAMHQRMGAWFVQKFGTSGFTMRLGPGQTGIDISAQSAAAMRRLGARHAEFKPRTASAERTFNRQLEKWGIDRSEVRVFTYDKDGLIYEGF